MVLTREGERLLVRAYGAGAPEPDDWGEVPATAYGACFAATGTMGFSAVYDLGFATSSLAAYTKQGILVTTGRRAARRHRPAWPPLDPMEVSAARWWWRSRPSPPQNRRCGPARAAGARRHCPR